MTSPLAATAQKGDHAVVRIVEIDPLETFVGVVEIPQRRLAFVNVIEMLHETAQAVVLRKTRQMPVELRVVVPLAPLAEFAAHEQQFFARMPVHPGIEHPEIGELLPFVARHFVDERAFAVHHLVVAQDQNEMFAETRRSART